MRPTLRGLALCSILATPALAQDPCLVQTGGAIGAPATWTISQGAPGDFWFLLFAVSEATTPVFSITLDVPIDLFQFSIDVGAFGFLDGAGGASFGANVPNDPSFVGTNFRAQAALGFLPSDTTNLTRLPLSAPRTFRATVEQPSAAATLAGGAILAGDKGALTFVGGSGLVGTTFDPRLERFTDQVLPFAAPPFTSSTVLADGRVLFCGGLDPLAGAPTDAAVLYDPVSGTATNLTMNHARLGHTTTLLDDGRVFVAGGLETIGIDLSNPTSLLDPATLLALANDIQASTEVFDPNALTFTPTANMLERRVLHTATKRSNGRVLLAGGVSVIPFLNVPTISSTANEYNPANNSFGFLPSFMGTARAGHDAVALPDGSVLVVGGVSADFSAAIASGDPADIVISALTSVERYTSSLFGGSFAAYADLATPRFLCSALRLSGGDVLVAGGFELDLSNPLAPVVGPSDAADLIEGPGQVAVVGDLLDARTLPILVELDTGGVLVVGGLALTAEVFQP